MTEGVSAGVTEGAGMTEGGGAGMTAGAERSGGSPGSWPCLLGHSRDPLGSWLPSLVPSQPHCVIPAKAGIHGHRQPSGFPLKTCGNDRGGSAGMTEGRSAGVAEGAGMTEGGGAGMTAGAERSGGSPGSWPCLLGHSRDPLGSWLPSLVPSQPHCVIPAKAGIHGHRQPSGFPLKTCGNDRVRSAGMTEEAVRA